MGLRGITSNSTRVSLRGVLKMELLIMGLIKVVDNMITTAKNIATYKNKKLLTALLVAISQMMFNMLTKLIVSEDSLLTDIVVSVGAFIGTYLVMLINEKAQKDATYTNILTCSSTASIEELCDYLFQHNIKCIPFPSKGKHKEDTLTVLAFATTRYESKLIDVFLEESETKYLRQVLH